jgi:L-ascorbate metabolism protein UlaG (beta-lactamase superfamily)
MKIKWYGHSAFQITTEKGIRIIIAHRWIFHDRCRYGSKDYE